MSDLTAGPDALALENKRLLAENTKLVAILRDAVGWLDWDDQDQAKLVRRITSVLGDW